MRLFRRKQPEPEDLNHIAEKMMGRKGDVFLHCSGCGCVFVAIFEPTNKELVGVGCPECKYAWPLGSARQ